MCSIGSKSPKGAKICEVCPACTHEVRKRTECMKCPLGFYSKEGWNVCPICEK